MSRRTINRDIDALSRAGIPVVTQQGAGGGIRIMEGFRMDHLLSWILSFAGGAELLEPAELREELSGIGEQISQQHKNMT